MPMTRSLLMVSVPSRPQRISLLPMGRESARSAGLLRGAVGRLGRPGILGPRVPRVAAPQLLAHLGVGALPEAAQVACRLDRSPVGSEQLEDDRHLPGADSRGLRQAEELLELRRRHDGAVLAVLERAGAAA